MKFAHVNENCLDARYCLPHGEDGPVSYDIEHILSDLKLVTTVLKRFTYCDDRTDGWWVSCKAQRTLREIGENTVK